MHIGDCSLLQSHSFFELSQLCGWGSGVLEVEPTTLPTLTFIIDVRVPVEGGVAGPALMAVPGVIAKPGVIAVPGVVDEPGVIVQSGNVEPGVIEPGRVGVVEGRGPAHTFLPQVPHKELQPHQCEDAQAEDREDHHV